MYYYRCAFLSLVALVMMPLSVSAACRADYPGYIGQLQYGKNEQIEDKVPGAGSLYLNTICGSSGVKVFIQNPTDSFAIYDNTSDGWLCETNLSMPVYRPDPNVYVLVYAFPAKGGDVVVNGCWTSAF